MANFSLVTKAIWIFIAPNWVRWCESVLDLSTNRRHVKVIIAMIWLRFAFRYGFYYGIWNMDHWNFVWLFWNNSFMRYSFSRDKFVQCKSHTHTHTQNKTVSIFGWHHLFNVIKACALFSHGKALQTWNSIAYANIVILHDSSVVIYPIQFISLQTPSCIFIFVIVMRFVLFLSYWNAFTNRMQSIFLLFVLVTFDILSVKQSHKATR